MIVKATSMANRNGTSLERILDYANIITKIMIDKW
jgi:hypothetical protein